ncbi:MAG: hypothetical protein Q9176_005677 [Flavoplaca citrina]
MSDGSSTNSSHILLTPSETVATPSVTLLDISQQGCEDLGASNSPLSELGVSGAALPMELDTNHMPDVTLSFQQPYVDENTYQHVGYQTGWTTNDGLPQPIYRAQSSSDDMDLAMDTDFLKSHTHTMDERFAAFNHAFLPEQQNPPITQGIDIPRYVPWSAAVTRPWSPEVLNDEQIERSPGAQELLYEPAMDFYPRSLAVRHGDMSFPSPDFVRKLDQNGFFGLDAQLNGESLPENNIDPPPPPDPVGPPTQMVDRNGRLSRKRANAGRGGRRHQPLNSHSRQNAKTKLDEICTGCKKKRMPSLLPICHRIRLQELARDFIPASLAVLRDTMRLRAFARARIHRWLDNHFEVCITWAHEFRPIKVGVTEIEPKGTSLLLQNQYRLNLLTNQYDLFQAQSPPLGIQLMSVGEWRVRLDGYLEEIIRGSFRRFPAICFRGDDCRVEKDFLIPIFDYHEAATGRVSLLCHLKRHETD